MTLKYLRSLDNDKLLREHKYNREWQLKWFNLYEEYYKSGIKDKSVVEHFERYTKIVKKIERVMNEKGIN